MNHPANPPRPEFNLPEPSGGIVLVGMGGAGKTTLSALLSLCAAERGWQVLAVDADATAALVFALGVPLERAQTVVPVSLSALSAVEGMEESVVTLWPCVMEDLLPDRTFGVRDRLRLLVVGDLGVFSNGGSCRDALGTLIPYLERQKHEVVIMDLGGLRYPEGLSEAVFSHALIVAEPTFYSLRSAEGLTRQLLERGIPHLHLVVNKIRTEQDIAKVKQFTTGLTCYEHVFSLPYDEEVRNADPDVSRLLHRPIEFMKGVRRIWHTLQENVPVLPQ